MKHCIRYLSIILSFVVITACTNNAITPISSSGTNNQINSPSNTNNVNTTTTFNSIGISASWQSFACQTGQTCLTTVDSAINSTVTICFSSPPTAGTYQLVSSTSLLAPGKAVLTVTNPPNQTAGSIWYSATGTTTVFTQPCCITASFTNIPCLNNPVSLDSVIVSGQVGCL